MTLDQQIATALTNVQSSRERAASIPALIENQRRVSGSSAAQRRVNSLMNELRQLQNIEIPKREVILSNLQKQKEEQLALGPIEFTTSEKDSISTMKAKSSFDLKKLAILGGALLLLP